MLGQKILVVDDEDYILRVVAYKLRGAGYRVTIAATGGEALQSALTDRPDLLITDLQMPGVSGLDLCRALSSTPPEGEPTDAAQPNAEPLRSVPSILLTARAHDLERPGTVLPDNLKRIISKPFSPRQLVLTVQELLQEAA